MLRGLVVWLVGSVPAAFGAGWLLRVAGTARDRRERRMFDGARR